MRIAIIPARGGSARVPRKNIAKFCGRPMLAYPLETARASGLFDLIAVSTDDNEIATCAFGLGAAVVPRPPDDGTTGTQEIAARVLDQLDVSNGIACVIYPTTPLLDVEHLLRGLVALMCPNAPPFAYAVGPDLQDAGCFYWGWSRAFRNRIPLDHGQKVELPTERVCDINTWHDMQRAETMFNALRRTT